MKIKYKSLLYRKDQKINQKNKITDVDQNISAMNLGKTLTITSNRSKVGKTTASVLLATQFAPQLKVCLVDASEDEDLSEFFKVSH